MSIIDKHQVLPCLSYKTDYLCSESNFISGLGSIFNLTGNFYNYNYSRTDSEADRIAIKSDWSIVAKDLYNSMDEFDEIIERIKGLPATSRIEFVKMLNEDIEKKIEEHRKENKQLKFDF